MFCGECGTENPETNRFCKNCGKELRRPPAAPVQASPVPPPPPVQSGQVPPVLAPAAAKPARNWIAVGALAVSLGSWAVYPVILGGLAVVIGIASLLWARKRRMNIPVTAILAIIIGLAAIIINIFWLDIFPPPEVLPPVR